MSDRKPNGKTIIRYVQFLGIKGQTTSDTGSRQSGFPDFLKNG